MILADDQAMEKAWQRINRFTFGHEFKLPRRLRRGTINDAVVHRQNQGARRDCPGMIRPCGLQFLELGESDSAPNKIRSKLAQIGPIGVRAMMIRIENRSLSV